MCGIIGAYSRNKQVEIKWIDDGLNLLRHRGPDDSGLLRSEDLKLVLGHRRLSVIDLTDGGRQPMVDDNTNSSLVFNGEIYNYKKIRNDLRLLGHKFYTDSDTEVLLKAYLAWGIACLDKLEGMFAFAIHDPSNNSLFLARDIAGEKPLYYEMNGNGFRFASELKAFIASSNLEYKLDVNSFECFLRLGFIPGSNCIASGINKLPPAHALVYKMDTGVSTTWRYWSTPIKNHIHSPQEIVAKCENILENVIGDQMVADVPLGILLSGGVDSSLIAALATRRADHVKTYTVSFSGFGSYDEAVHADLVARHLNTDHHTIDMGLVDVSLLAELARQYDEPIIDSSIIPTYLLCKCIRQHCTVALGGDGADELFGGYKHYSRIASILNSSSYFPPALRILISKLMLSMLPDGARGGSLLRVLSSDLRTHTPILSNLFTRKGVKNLLPLLKSMGYVEDYWKKNELLDSDLVERLMKMDFQNYLPEDILVKTDRASMLASLELRSPFLDKRVIEFAYRDVPMSMKVTGQNRKIVLKELAKKILPKEFDLKRKQGFSIPLALWLKKGEWRIYFEGILLDKKSIFDALYVRKLFSEFDSGTPHQERLFGLVMFELWRREYKLNF
jgi:asparagine synthase (glutamine-hydrolysing)